MKENILQKNYRHETFGGLINEADFYIGSGGKTNSKGSINAAKICSAQKFDRMCMLNALSRDKREKEKKELKEM